jgi:PASTA domain
MVSAAEATSPGWLLGSLITLSGLAIVAAIVFTFLNRRQPPDQAGVGIVRSLLALVLVGGLMILAGASFSLADVQTRNLLIGGIVASASGAVAFYFASRGADDARKDLLTATLGSDTVPELVGMTVDQAKAAMSVGPLALKVPESAQPTDQVKDQTPKAGTSVQRGSSVMIVV